MLRLVKTAEVQQDMVRTAGPKYFSVVTAAARQATEVASRGNSCCASIGMAQALPTFHFVSVTGFLFEYTPPKSLTPLTTT